MVFIFEMLVLIFTWVSRIGIVFTLAWKALKFMSMRPALWFWLGFYPVLEFLIELFTGHKGPLSASFQWLFTAIMNLAFTKIFNLPLQSLIDQIPANVQQFCCYLGLTSALQTLTSGIVGALIYITTTQFIILTFLAKAKLMSIRFRIP